MKKQLLQEQSKEIKGIIPRLNYWFVDRDFPEIKENGRIIASTLTRESADEICDEHNALVDEVHVALGVLRGFLYGPKNSETMNRAEEMLKDFGANEELEF